MVVAGGVVSRPGGPAEARAEARGGARRGARRGVRLTRRGRLVLLAFLLLLAALVVVIAAPASRAADPAGSRPTVVVRPGDTLWSVTERHLPGRDPFGVIEEIRRLNGLPDYTLQPGQRLLLPDPR